MITVVDYGMGNLHSVVKAFGALGVDARVCSESDTSYIKCATAIVLPGVGSFRRAMGNLSRNGLEESLNVCRERGIPILGICLGMQLFSERGEEGGEVSGLGFIPGRTAKLVGAPKLPHVGWNTLSVKKPFPGLAMDSQGVYMYFTHSFVVAETGADVVAATTSYGVEFVAAIQKENMFGVQFHPEKSGALGLRLLREFAREAGENPC